MRKFKVVYMVSIITASVILVVSQMLLKNSELKNKLSLLYEIESQYVYSENNINEGYIVINVSSPSENLFLLQNGEKIAVLNAETTKINISDNSVIEIDGRLSDSVCTVKIEDFSENISGFYEKTVEIKSNIVILGRFFIK